MYAKLIFGLPLDGPFDYLIPDPLRHQVHIGSRVKVSFGHTRRVGYVIDITPSTTIARIKPILKVLDDVPLIDERLLALTKTVAQYYCCSWGEALEAGIPASLRLGRQVSSPPEPKQAGANGINPACRDANGSSPDSPPAYLVHGIDFQSRLAVYERYIRQTIGAGRNVILLLPQVQYCQAVAQKLGALFHCQTDELYRDPAHEMDTWLRIKREGTPIVVGTRSTVFAPVPRLGLVIIDEEQDEGYKQQQVPHYHARQVAHMRCEQEHCLLLCGSSCPSAEAWLKHTKGSYTYERVPIQHTRPAIKLLPSQPAHVPKKKASIVVPYIQDAIAAAIHAGGAVLVFLNRSGFATVARCGGCGMIMKCQRCDIHLVYHYEEKLLRCHYCGYSAQAPLVCPVCNAGYIKYSGAGTEKIESELARIFPSVNMLRYTAPEQCDLRPATIVIATESIVKDMQYAALGNTGPAGDQGIRRVPFNLVVVLSVDAMLARNDYKTQERVYQIISNLRYSTSETMIIQTRYGTHQCFEALMHGDDDFFYQQELQQRKQLLFPPYHHFGIVHVRGQKETAVKDACTQVFGRFKESEARGLEVVSMVSGQPYRLRGRYYWQIILKSPQVSRLSAWIKSQVQKCRFSGIIVSVDIDPI